MTNDGTNTLLHDAENRLLSATNGGSSGTYSYEGRGLGFVLANPKVKNGLRVKKVSASTTTVTIFSGGQDIAEYVNGAAPSSPSVEFIYAGSQLIADISGSTTYYFHQDQLSNRLLTDSSGNVATQRGNFPFGEEWYQTGVSTKWKFTNYARDTESGNDYALARSYVNRLARFSSVDPLSGTVSYPQSLNKYSYVMNDPINLADYTGMGPSCTAAQRQDGDCGHQINDAVGSSLCRDQLGGSSCIPGLSSFFGLDEFDLLILAFTPTDYLLQTDRSPGCLYDYDCAPDKWTPVYGNMEAVLNLLQFYQIASNAYSNLARTHGQSPAEAAANYCEDRGQLSGTLPRTGLPMTLSGSFTIGPVNYNTKNEVTPVIPAFPWPEWLSFGAGLDIGINVPKGSAPSWSWGLGKNLGIAFYPDAQGHTTGIDINLGPSIGPPVVVSPGSANTCGLKTHS